MPIGYRYPAPGSGRDAPTTPLRLCGLTVDDVSTHLRTQSVGELAGVKYLIYEATGQLTVVRHDAGGTSPLIREALDRSAASERDRAAPPRRLERAVLSG